MIFKANSKELQEYLKTLGDKEVEIKKYRKTTTSQQMRALHLWFSLLAKSLRDSGFDLRAVLKKDVDIMATPYLIKEMLFRPTFKQITEKKHTSQLTTQEINDCFDIITKAIGERTGARYVAFPSIESLLSEDLNKYENDN